MRLITHIKALTEAANLIPEHKKPKKTTLPSKPQPINNLTHEKFEIKTPERGSIAMRRSLKRDVSSTSEDHKPLLLPDQTFSFDFDEKRPVTSYSTFEKENQEPGKNQEPHKRSFSLSLSRSLSTRNPSRPPTLKRKHSKAHLDGLVKRVKSVKVAPSRQRLREWFDDTENDMKRYALRSPALEALPLQDSLNVESSAEAMERCAAVLDYRRASLGFAVY